MAPRRLPLSVLAALGLTAPGCEPEPPMMPCLSCVPDGAQRDASNRAQHAGPIVGPCLSPMMDTGGPPTPPVDPPPEMTVCLSIAPEEPRRPPEDDANEGANKKVRKHVLDRDVLPEDVVKVLRDKES